MKKVFLYLLLICFFSTPDPARTGQTAQQNIGDFDIATILAKFKSSKSITINGREVSDLGQAINKADAKLGKETGIINVINGGNFLTPAYPSENRHIKLFKGVYKSKVQVFREGATPTYGRIIYPKNNTVISGESWDAIIEEAQDIPNTPPRRSLITPFNTTLVLTQFGESTANIAKSSNIHIIGLRFRGNPLNTANDIGLSSVGIGNDDFSSVQNCFFERVNAYGVSVGATPGENVVGKVLPDGRNVGYHARNCAVLRNKFEGVLGQNLGLITFDGLIVADNLFINPGKLQPNGTHSPFFAVMDVEPNGSPREIIRGLKMIRNTIDGRNALGSRYWGAIAFQITNPVIFNELNEISDNEILGGENIFSTDEKRNSGMTYGIYVTSSATNDLIVARNRIKNAGQPGLQLSGNNIRVLDTTMENVGGGGSPAMSATDLKNSTITRTKITLTPGGVPGSLDIFELGINKNNLWEQNEANSITHLPKSIVTDSIYRKNLTRFAIKESPNSRKNRFDANNIQK